MFEGEPLADLELLVGGAVERGAHRTEIVLGASPGGGACACGLGFAARLGQVLQGDSGQVREDRQPVVECLLEQVGLGLRDSHSAMAAAHDLDEAHGHERVEPGSHLGRADAELGRERCLAGKTVSGPQMSPGHRVDQLPPDLLRQRHDRGRLESADRGGGTEGVHHGPPP